jgi:hypothetical protein
MPLDELINDVGDLVELRTGLVARCWVNETD